MSIIKKAIFPVAGLGTRFLPATKAQPKEMLTVIDKPLIQFAVEEAINAGITQLIFVIGRTKRSIADHFDSNPELDIALRSKGNVEMADYLNAIVPPDVACIYFRQAEAFGLGHAVACAAPVIDPDEHFAVFLADDLMDGKVPVMTQMVQSHAQSGRSVLAVQQVRRDEVSSYGMVDADLPTLGAASQVRDIVEKPNPSDAPSTLAVAGRYILSGQIMKTLKTQAPGNGGEVQLTDAIQKLIPVGGVDAYRFDGHRYDCGSKLGYIEATMTHALAHPEFGTDVRRMMQDLLASSDPHASFLSVAS